MPRRATLALLCSLAAAAAAAGPVTSVTLGQVQAEAEARAASIRVAQRQLDVARADVQVAGALLNPTLTLLTSRLSPRFEAGVSLPMPIFGQRELSVRAARADAEAVALGVGTAALEARAGAAAAWLDLWAAQRRAGLLGSAAAAARRFLDLARERFQAGSAPRLDVLRATAEDARAAAEAQAARAAIDAAAARLVVWLEVDPEAQLLAAGEPAPLEGALPQLPALLATARAHPLLRRDRAQVVAAAAHVAAEGRLRWPVVSGQVSVSVGDPGLTGTDVIGGASFDLPVLSLRGGPIARARAAGQLADATLALDERRTVADVRDAYHTLAGAQGRARALRGEVLPAAEEAQRMTEDSYREGRADLVRLLEAQRAAVDAGLAEVDAVAAWGKARAELERAVGRRLDGR